MPYRTSTVPRLPKKRNRLLELAVSAVVLSVLAGILLNKLLFYQEMAEKAKMEYMISNFKSALRIRMADMLIQGRARDYPSLINENPVDWLESKPMDYQGRLPEKKTKEPLAAGWYYDSSTHILTYLVDHGRYFQPDSEGQKRVRLQVVLTKNMSANAKEPEITGAQIVLVEPYRWF
jgi:general secretion pathway protein G